MTPFRFSFETDQQYQARIQGSAVVTQPVKPSEAIVSAQPVNSSPPPAANAPIEQTVQVASVPAHLVQPPASGTFMSIPLWMIVVFILFVTVSVYETNRRELIKALTQVRTDESPPTRKRRKVSLRKRLLRFLRTSRKKFLLHNRVLKTHRPTPPPIFRWRPVPDGVPRVIQK